MPMPSPDPELALLAGVVLGTEADVAAWDIEPGSHERVLQRARRHGLIGLLARLPAGTLPHALAARVHQAQRQQAIASLNALAENLALAQLLESQSIRTLALKGVTLSHMAYGDRTIRCGNDVDIWIPPDAVRRAHETLRSAGYRRATPEQDLRPSQLRRWMSIRHAFTYRSPRGVSVDLHWRLHDVDRLLPLGFDEAYAASQPLPVGTGTLRMLRSDHAYAHALTHAARSEWTKLIWLADATRLRALAAQEGHDIEAFGLRKLNQQLRCIEERLKPASHVAAAFTEPADDVGERPSLWRLAANTAYQLGLRSELSYRWEVVRNQWLRPTASEILLLPDLPWWLLLLVRPVSFWWNRRT